MSKSFFFTIKSSQSRSGFTLVEVLTGMVISIMTISMSANLVVTANIYKVVAKKNVAMQLLIQSDLEKVRSTAKFLARDDDKCPNNISASNANNYAGAANYANALRTALPVVVSATDPNVRNETYSLTRTPLTITEHNVLPINYEVKRSGSSTVEYSIYTEVIPNASFECPSI
jgi:Tfp pilus assembly protein PilV